MYKMTTFLLILSVFASACGTLSKTERKKRGIILSKDVKILKPVLKCEVPDYFRVSFLDENWFKWLCEHPNQKELLTEELDECQMPLRKPTDKLVNTCRRVWMFQVWLTTESEKRRHLAIKTLNSTLAIMRVNGWSQKKIHRFLNPFEEAEIVLSPTP